MPLKNRPRLKSKRETIKQSLIIRTSFNIHPYYFNSTSLWSLYSLRNLILLDCRKTKRQTIQKMVYLFLHFEVDNHRK